MNFRSEEERRKKEVSFFVFRRFAGRRFFVFVFSVGAKFGSIFVRPDSSQESNALLVSLQTVKLVKILSRRSQHKQIVDERRGQVSNDSSPLPSRALFFPFASSMSTPVCSRLFFFSSFYLPFAWCTSTACRPLPSPRCTRA